MNIMTPRTLTLALAVASCVTLVHAQTPQPASPSTPAAPAAAPETLRPAVQAAVQAGQQLLAAGKFREALAKAAEAEAVPDRTPYENFVIDYLRGGAASGAGENEIAIRSFEAVVKSGRLSAADNLPLVERLVGSSFRLKDYPRSIEWARRYLKDGGTNPQVRRVLANSLLLSGDTAGAIPELQAILSAEEAAGRAPPEDLLRVLGSSQLKVADNAAYLQTLERLLRHHPKPAYWRDRISQLQNQPQFDAAALIDSFRLLGAVGAMEEASEYLTGSELAVRAGLPGEARRVIDAGYAAGKLGAGADAAAHQAQRDRVTRSAAQDAASLPATPAPAANATAEALVSLGLAYASAGRAEAGIPLVEQGLVKGGLKQPELVRLRLGWLQAGAGRADAAKASFAAVQATGGSAGDLARLWGLHLARPAAR
jgi:hypothetical protein